MAVDYNLISGILSGSLVTLFFKWLLDRFDKKAEFNREIYQVTYLKKLEIAESAVAYYWTYQSQLLEMKKSLENMFIALKDDNNSNNDPQIILSSMNKNSEILTQLSNEKYFNINGIHLYFDLEDEQAWSESDFGEMLSCMAETKYFDTNIQFWSAMYIKHTEKEENESAELCWKKVDQIMPQYIDLIQKLINHMEKHRLATYSMITKIKQQLRK